MRDRSFLCITLLLACHPQVWPQTLTKQFPPTQTIAAAAAEADDFDLNLPVAQPVAEPPSGVPVLISADTQEKRGDIYTLTGHVVIHYRDYVVTAEKASYNSATGDVEATGHLTLSGGPDHEQIQAESGKFNLGHQTGEFHSVTGSVSGRGATPAPAAAGSNTFLFSGREVIKYGPERYRVLGGSMTSCQLPDPDWRLVASQISLNNGTASAHNSVFSLFRIPLLYLPYVTHPVNAEGPQTGFLIPSFGTSSSKGTIVGAQFFWAINRSMDLTVGSQYYSKRGFAPRAEFRMRGFGQDFLTARFNALFDRLSGAANQGGEDVVVDGRYDLTPHTRAVGDVEYLSSYIYRQAFEENFALAISSEVKSQLFLTHENRGIAESFRIDRYQSFETTAPGQQIRILHTPSLEAEAVDHSLDQSPLLWGFSASVAGLSRSEPSLQNANQTTRIGSYERVDVFPRVSLPFSLDGWRFHPELAFRETFYPRSQNQQQIVPNDNGPTLNREYVQTGIEIHPPALERDFSSPLLERVLGGDLRHTIEPSVQYRYVAGIDNFRSILRFDDTDIVSDTNEVEYGLTQRFFLRHLHTHPCRDDEPFLPAGCGGGTVDWLSWQVAQKYFFRPHFGGAVVPGQRNVLDTTLDLTGAAFLTGPRDISPVISRLRLRSTSSTDVEWDLDYDPKMGRITASNVFVSYHRGDYTFAAGHARLNAPEGTLTTQQLAAGAVTNYNQLRLLLSYGNPGKRGFSIGANSGYDIVLDALQFGGIQTGYNWDCCGLNFEYRRYALGSVRNENQYLYSFTLAGIGTAGNLRRAVRIF